MEKSPFFYLLSADFIFDALGVFSSTLDTELTKLSQACSEVKEFNKSIVAKEKPYFMRYIYPEENNKYKKYIDEVNNKSLMLFRVGLEELLKKETRTEDEEKFIDGVKSTRQFVDKDSGKPVVELQLRKEYDDGYNPHRIYVENDMTMYLLSDFGKSNAAIDRRQRNQ